MTTKTSLKPNRKLKNDEGNVILKKLHCLSTDICDLKNIKNIKKYDKISLPVKQFLALEEVHE